MTEEELIQIAEAVAQKRLMVESMGMRNSPNKTEDRVKSDAAYMIAQDTLTLLECKYNDALRQFVAQSPTEDH